jgi:hypothetical protein
MGSAMNETRLLFAVLAGLATGPVAAKDTPESPLVSALVACKAELDDARRLACYDRTASALADATAKGQIAVVDREDVRKTRRALFGFVMPKLPFFSDDDSAKDTPDVIESTVVSVRAEKYGMFTVVIDGGAIWRTSEIVRRDPKPGSTVRIKRGAVGGYFIGFDGGIAVRAARIG